MTASPYSIGPDESLETAHGMMRRYQVRHLPVLEYGNLVGIVSQRDLYLIESLPGVIVRDTRVQEAMSEDAYCVQPDAWLDDVAREMADKKYGCAVVMKGTDVRGIFTTTDALLALSKLLRARDAEAHRTSCAVAQAVRVSNDEGQ
ncbi:CBS domain-containing protein [Pendulispora brunnea]|uniref:CBS domain-containing protein n=1 Tax=Pendulispora brunnea TaxID=2905690 RepID=A0ABZ2KNM4_9BACT